MSDSEPVDLRDLPPVPPVSVPARFSQTLLRHEENCPRAAYLYLRHKGGMPARELDRGTAAHAIFERMLTEEVARGERLAGTDDEPGQVASLTAAVVDEVLSERTDLVVSRYDADKIREMAYHWAVGYDVDPSSVLGVERTFVLDLAGVEVRGKIDVAYVLEEVAAGVDDYKTTFNVPGQDEYEEGFQGPLYAVLLAFGQPIDLKVCGSCCGERVLKCRECGGMDCYPGSPVLTDDDVELALCTTCGAPGKPPTLHDEVPCSTCKGRGQVEVRGEPIGEWIQWVRTREVFPRYLWEGPRLASREVFFTRQELHDVRADLERQVRRLQARFVSWKFPAMAGSHCQQCPCRPECPLPEALRDHAGTINSMVEAEEAAEKIGRDEDELAARRRELRNFAKLHGPVRAGTDQVYDFVSVEKRSVKRVGQRTDWDGFQAAVLEAVEFGTPFDLEEWVRRSGSTSFKRIKVGEDEPDGS